MPKVLLHSNRRIATLGLCVSLVLALMSLALVIGEQASWLRGMGLVILMISVCLGIMAWMFRTAPRVALSDTELHVYVRSLRRPFRIPLDVVEVFFMGQGAVSGDEPGHPRDYSKAVAANVIVRLAESQSSWHGRDVNIWLAVWAEGYITLRGLWCENIDQELLKTMNSALAAAKRNLRKGNAE